MDAPCSPPRRSAGARVLQPARCESLHGPLTVRHLDDQRAETLRPTWTLLADGKGRCSRTAPSRPTDFGVKATSRAVHGPRATPSSSSASPATTSAPRPSKAVGRTSPSASPPPGSNASAATSTPLAKTLQREKRVLAAPVRRGHAGGIWLATPLPRFGVAAPGPTASSPSETPPPPSNRSAAKAWASPAQRRNGRGIPP